MQLDDSRIRKLVLAACPHIEPKRLEVNEMDYGARMGFWYRKPEGGVQLGSAIALQRTEAEVATELAAELLGTKAKADILEAGANNTHPEVSPYEGRAGRHPDSCTCSKHLKATSGQAQTN